ncbi:glycosyltransferase family 39 protein [Fluviicola sp.]|uniref:glycosyltransferase family 39 protein n=1 Tax=Fluviicola sp. TaxID=1917219 RepID=UPI0026081B62|nr:glycosyltransferase family 39 protein [Fluviicola sp.]
MTRSVQITYYLSFLLVFSYVIIRGFSLGITHDEALTYKIIQGDEILRETANHHWLNTHLSAFFASLFGAKEFVLRLPNILSFAIFWFYLYRIAKTFLSSSFTQIALILLLCGNPFVLDFFSLCRGYGMSLAFITASLYYLFRIYQSNENKSGNNHAFAMGFAILALASNLNTLNYFLIALALVLLNLVLTKPKHWIIWLSGITLVCAMTLFFSLDQLFFLKNKNELYYGSGRLSLTIDNLFFSGLYLLEGFKELIVLRYLLYISILTAIVVAFRKKQWFNPGIIALVVLTSIVLALFLEHLLFDALYPIGRSTLYLYPVILLALLLNFDGIRFKLFRVVILTLSWGFASLNLFTINLSQTITWPEDRHVKEGMLLVKNDIRDKTTHTISCTWIYEPMINYYRSEYQVPVHAVFRDGINDSTEYNFIQFSDPAVWKNIKGKKHLLSHIRECGLVVYKNPVISAN